MTPASAKESRPLFEWLTIIAFLLLLWLPTADHFLHLDHSRPIEENRRLAPPPVYKGFLNLSAFTAGFDAYFSDHFGFRKQLLRWSNRWKNNLFHDASAPEVLLGRDGWLYFSGDQMFEHIRRARRFSEDDMENWRRLIQERRDWCAARSIAYVFVIAPDKQTIYPEHLPDWLDVGPGPSKVEQFVNFLATHPNNNLNVVDLSSPLRDAKKIRQDYLRTDTHWNLFGAFVGYRAAMDALTNQVPGLIAPSADFYGWTNDPRPFVGDLAKMLAHDEDSHDENALLLPVAPFAAEKFNLEPIYDAARIPQETPAEPKPFFTRNPQARGKAILFHDSFGADWRNYLGGTFNEVLDIHRYAWVRPLIEREKPNVVIDEMVERKFNTGSPLDLLRLDISSETNQSPRRFASQP